LLDAAMKFAVCHPDRFIKARGLCSTCYAHAYEQGRFPHRKVRVNIMGAINLGVGLPEAPDPAHWLRGMPMSCRKCHAPANSLQALDGRVHCQLCGWDAVLTVRPGSRPACR
jgi:hypothetical protein